jgi:protease-4
MKRACVAMTGLLLLCAATGGTELRGEDRSQASIAPPAPQVADPRAELKPQGEANADDAAKVVRQVAWVRLAGPLRDGPPPHAWASQEAGAGIRDIIAELNAIAADPNFAGVVFRFDRPQLSMTQVDELVEAIDTVKAGGLTVVAFAEEYDLPTYVLACHADHIVLQNKGQMSLSGIAVEEMYFAGLLEKLGVKADLVQVGQHKGAADPFVLRGPSDAWNQNIDPLIDDMYAHLLKVITESRQMERPAAEQALAEAWALDDQMLLKRKLIDRISSRDMTEITGELFGDDFEWHEVGQAPQGPKIDSPFALFQLIFQPPAQQIARPSIMVINAYGPIVSGDGEGSLLGGEVVASDPVLDALADATDNEMIKGVVVRIDSPGGSALASEMIWQGIRAVAEEKPVFVSIGGMAASGGYYLACAGQRIFINPSAIVGSIGVVGGKVTMGGLYDKLGLHVHRRSRGPVGDLFNSVEPFTQAQRQLIAQAFERTYEQFTARVMAGRGQRVGNIADVAQGKLFTGRQAVENGLADEIGGERQAVIALANQLGLEEGQYDIVDYPPPMTFSEFLNRMFGGGMASASAASPLQAAQQAVGPRAWRQIRWGLNGLMLLQRESTLLLLPTVLVVR